VNLKANVIDRADFSARPATKGRIARMKDLGQVADFEKGHVAMLAVFRHGFTPIPTD
jgi:hypothetical protein